MTKLLAPLTPQAHAVAVTFEAFGSPALTELVRSHLVEHPEETDALARFTMAHGLPRQRPAIPTFQKTNQTAADAVLVLREQQPTPFKFVFPSKVLGAQVAEWVYSQLTNTGNARPSDPKFPWGVLAMRDWLFNGPLNARADAVSARFWRAADEMTREPSFGAPPSVRALPGRPVASGGRAPLPAQAQPTAPAPVTAKPRTGYVNPWEAVANPSFSDYLRAVSRGYGQGWLEYQANPPR